MPSDWKKGLVTQALFEDKRFLSTLFLSFQFILWSLVTGASLVAQW